MLIAVRGAVPSLRPAERRVAEAVLADPAGISESSITTVARLCQTSETTVLRFCRAIGLAGYPELRIALARAAQFEETDQDKGAPLTDDIAPNDPLSDVVAKITHADVRAITDTAAALDLAILQKAVDALVAAARIDIYGVGASGLVGTDFHSKLHRIGLISFIATDLRSALTSAALLGPGDVALGISHTGTTTDVVDALREARRQGAMTIAVTNYARSPITAEADLILVTAARETTFRTGAMASRSAALAVLDCLFAGVAQHNYERSIESLENAQAMLSGRQNGRS